MSKTMVLGLNCAHDAAACLSIDGKVMVAVSEERLARQKHKSGFPKLAINYCLKEVGLDRESVIFDSIVINQQPPADYDCIAKQYFPAMPGSRVLVNPSHHYLHACYALTLTEQRPLVILVVDGSGYSYAEHRRRGSPLLGSEPRDHDMWESLTAFYVDTNGEWSLLIKDWGLWKDSALRFPSLGHMYGLAAQRIFGSWVHAGKVMGLAPYGNPLGLGEEPIVTLTENGIEVNTDWILKMPSITFNSNFEEVQTARDLAAKVQAELECSMMHLCGILHARTKCDSICVTGGVALNSVFNGRLAMEGPFRNVIVSPAAHDGGTAIGAAAYGFNQVTGRQLEFQRDPEFLGRVYSEREVWDVLTQYPESKVEKCTCAIQSAARDLAAGKMVGWFEGGAEFGPRALGHRSILGNPAVPEMKDMLNRRVKFRESFRPYAAAVLLEHAAAWFENPPESPHMLMVAVVKPDKRGLIPAVVHVDNTCRLQTLRDDYAGSLRPIVEAFLEITGIPLVLNTSLNVHGEPISETPQDALNCLMRSGLDVLYFGNFRVEKTLPLSPINDLHDSYPVPSAEYHLVCRYAVEGEHSHQTNCWIQQGNRRVALTGLEKEVLLAATGLNTVSEIAARIPVETLDRVAECVQLLCDRGVLYLKMVPKGTALPPGLSQEHRVASRDKALPCL